ncbi:MAG: hypothetical protein PWR10_1562 [Halanaerobiales bacterium]|nr:hypothetical protein [Halanaerobiales bacterium]
MARVRMEDEEKIQNWEEADLVMKEIAELELRKEELENQMNQKISDIKLEYSDKAEPIQKRIKQLSKDLKRFVTLNRIDIKGKSKKLNFGQVGFRKSTRLTIPSKIKNKIIEMLEKRGMSDCIIVKKKVNRDVLKSYPDDVIVGLGATKKITDTFWYETDREKITS